MSIAKMKKVEIYCYSIKDLYALFAKYKFIEPSHISLLKETGESALSDLFLFKSTGEIIEFKEVVDGIRLHNMKSLYWD